MNPFKNFFCFEGPELSSPYPNLCGIHLFFPFLLCYCICLQNVEQEPSGEEWGEKECKKRVMKLTASE